MGIGSVAVYSEADANAPHVRDGRRGVLPRRRAGRRELSAPGAHPRSRAPAGAKAIHPGYGFLSENAGFAEACEARGHRLHRADARADARLRAQAHGARAGASMRPAAAAGHAICCADLPAALAAAERIGYPGDAQEHRRRRRHRHAPLQRRARARASPSPPCSAWPPATSAMRGVFLEKFVARARHIEVQIFGDGRGTVIALGERDCSVQRRNQKVIEESPAPGLERRDARASCAAAAVRLGEAVGYRSAGTVEFVYDADAGAVLLPRSEHAPAGGARRHRGSRRHRPGGVDDPHRGGRAAGSGARIGIEPRGHAIQARVYAEDPARNFRPVERPADARRTTRANGRARRWLGRDRHRSHARYYDPHARQDHRARRDARRSPSPSSRAALRRSRASTASRPTSPICVSVLRASGVRRRRADHRAAGQPRTRRRPASKCWSAGTHDHGAGLAGTPGLLGRRRAALGPDGCAGAATRQSHGRQ